MKLRIGWQLTSCILISCVLLKAETPKFDTILYGAAFYEEYMPTDRLEEDVRLMQEAGISVVRLGESTWGGKCYEALRRSA